MTAQMDDAAIARRLQTVQERIADAAAASGRSGEDVLLVAVSKTQPAEAVVAAWNAGVRVFGENRVEEAAPKSATVAMILGKTSGPDWHMIGHVQSRKVAAILPWAKMVQSVDSLRLAGMLSQRAVAAGTMLPILLEVNISGEPSKYGFQAADLWSVVGDIAGLPGLRPSGLMTVAPLAADPEAARPVFRRLRQLRDELAIEYPACDWSHLSMGMTDDFPIAVQEGATIVRIGRAIFGERS